MGSPFHSIAHICEKKKSDFWFCSLNQNIIRIPGCEPGRGGAHNCVCMHSANDHTPMRANSHVLNPQPYAFLVPQETDSIRPLNPSMPLWRVFSFVTLGGAPAPSLLPDGACTYYKKDFFFFFFQFESLQREKTGKCTSCVFIHPGPGGVTLENNLLKDGFPRASHPTAAPILSPADLK